MRTMEQYLKEHFNKGNKDFYIKTLMDNRGKIHLYITPRTKEGSTIEFLIHGNRLSTLFDDNQ